MSTAALDTLPPASHAPRLIELTVLNALGVELPKSAKILDFGCGAGRTIGSLRALGNAYFVTDATRYIGLPPIMRTEGRGWLSKNCLRRLRRLIASHSEVIRLDLVSKGYLALRGAGRSARYELTS